MSSINLDNAYLLFLIIPLVLLFAVPFAVAVKKQNANGHNIASLALHIIIAVLIAFTAAGTTIITTVTETNVYVLADVSYSANKNLDTVDEYINRLGGSLPGNSKMGVICFGKDYKLITRLGHRFSTVKNSGVDDSQTDIVNALGYAGTLFRADVVKHVVVITDGKQTYEGDSNSLKRAADALVAKNIKVHAIYLDDNIKMVEDEGTAPLAMQRATVSKEVQISGVEYSPRVYAGRMETLEVQVQSNCETQATLSLFRENELVAERAAQITRGSNSVSFNELYTGAAGEYEYDVTIEADGDDNNFNNSYSFTQTVSDSLNVLLLTERRDDYSAIRSFCGENAVIDAYINDYDIPVSVEALCAYDEIIISNYDITKLSDSYCTTFIKNIETVVSLFGKSLITIGDTGISSENRIDITDFEDMLPVNFGNNNQESKLYTIVIDASRSMSKLGKLSIAKKAAIKLIDMLNEDDEVCVVSFYGDYDPVQIPPTSVANKEYIKQQINSIQPMQGTYLGNGLIQAFNAIKDFNYGEKQVMLISDGMSSTLEADDPEAVVRNMYANNIYTSVIDVGRSNVSAKVDSDAITLLKNLAVIGNGEYFFADTEDLLENAVFKELDMQVNEKIINDFSTVNVTRPRDEYISQFAEKITNEKPYVQGFINGKKRDSANNVLSVTYQKPNGGSVEVPLFSYWARGNGRVASFTSDIAGDWIAQWQEPDGIYDMFFESMFEHCLPAEKIDCPYKLGLTTENGRTTAQITVGQPRGGANASISVVLPDGSVVSGNMSGDAATFSYAFESSAVGKYEVTVNYSYADTDYVSKLAFFVPYLPEYDCFTVFEASGLRRMVGTDGKFSITGDLTIENDAAIMDEYVIDCTAALLIACVVLFAIDIVVRKLKWEDIKSLFGKGKK